MLWDVLFEQLSSLRDCLNESTFKYTYLWKNENLTVQLRVLMGSMLNIMLKQSTGQFGLWYWIHSPNQLHFFVFLPDKSLKHAWCAPSDRHSAFTRTCALRMRYCLQLHTVFSWCWHSTPSLQVSARAGQYEMQCNAFLMKGILHSNLQRDLQCIPFSSRCC